MEFSLEGGQPDDQIADKNRQLMIMDNIRVAFKF